MKFLGIFGAVASFAGSSAMAAPIYLDCTFTTPPNPPFLVKMTLDEAAQNATLSMPSTGKTQRLPAVFSESSVAFGDGDRISALHYVVSRIDLTVERTLSIGGKPSDPDKAKCTLVTPPKRAF